MAFLLALTHYCTPLTRQERVELTRLSLNLNTSIQLKQILFELGAPSFLLAKLEPFVHSLKNELVQLQLAAEADLLALLWAMTGLLALYCLHTELTAPQLDSVLARLRPYLLLYVLVDHTLDKEEASYADFKAAFYATLTGAPLQVERKELVNCASLLQQLMQLSPLALPELVTAARVEFKSVALQKQPHEALQLCYEKGSSSTLAACAVMSNGLIYEGVAEFGYFAQLVDDLLDLEEDLAASIDSYPLQCLRREGNVDTCVNKIGTLINELPVSYHPIKACLLHCLATYLLNCEYISSTLRQALLPYSFLLYRGFQYPFSKLVSDLLASAPINPVTTQEI